MGTTLTGLPYPEPTDPIAAGADAIKALAEAAGGGPLSWQGSYAGGPIPLTTTPTGYTPFSFVAPVAGTYAVWVSAYFQISASSATCTMHAALDVDVNPVGVAFTGVSGSAVSLTDFGRVDLPAGTHQVLANAAASADATIVSITGFVELVRIGT